MKLQDKPTNKLEGELKGLKIITGALIGVLGLLVLICIYGLLTKEDKAVFGSLIAVAIALSPMILVNASSMNKIKLELKSRENES